LFPGRLAVRIFLVPTVPTPFWKSPTFIVAIICMLVFFAVMMFTSGAGGMRKTEAKSLGNARNICLACRRYSREHGGVFPTSLDPLFPQYLPDRAVLASPLNPAEPVGYTYTFPGPGKTDSPDTIVIEDNFAPTLVHARIVVYANASARVLPIP
jgi:hypothetical protein